MEKAAKEAIEALPLEERRNRVFSPDVMLTEERGWLVVEGNASAAEGSSLWLEENPLIIDAYVSHMTKRDPMHVKFIRDLLHDRLKSSRQGHRGQVAKDMAREKPLEGILHPQYELDTDELAESETPAAPPSTAETVAPTAPATTETTTPTTTKPPSEAAATPSPAPKLSRKDMQKKEEAETSQKVIRRIQHEFDSNGTFSHVKALLHRMNTKLDDNHKIAIAREVGAGEHTSGSEAWLAVEEKVLNDYARKKNKRLAGVNVAEPDVPTGADPQHLAEDEAQQRSADPYNTERRRQVDFARDQAEREDLNRAVERRRAGEQFKRDQQTSSPSGGEDERQRNFDPNEEYTRQERFRRRNEVRLSTDWSESDHPRQPKGSSHGGEFKKRRGSAYGITTVKLGRLKVTYSLRGNRRIKGGLKLHNYQQEDIHSCGFVAALTIARYFKPGTDAKKVLDAVRPSVNHGVDRFNLLASLKKLGIRAKFKRDLTVNDLRRYVARGIPVIVSVWPEDWFSDHWTVVQGFDRKRVFLTNHSSLPVKFFRKQWSDMDMRGQGDSGEGIVCFPPLPKKKRKGGKALSEGAGYGNSGEGGTATATAKPTQPSKPQSTYRPIQRDNTTTYEGVPLSHAKNISREEADSAIQRHDNMTLIQGSNLPNRNLPNETRPELNEHQRGALQKYSYLNDGPLNRKLRGNEDWHHDPKTGKEVPYGEEFYNRMHEHLQSAFAQAKPMKHPVRVVRGMNFGPDREKEHAEFISKMQHAAEHGKQVGFNGYTSTTRPNGLMYHLGMQTGVRKPFQGNVTYKIDATHGLDMQPHSQLTGEGEFLLPHGARFNVHKVEQVGGGHHIHLKQIPPNEHHGEENPIMFSIPQPPLEENPNSADSEHNADEFDVRTDHNAKHHDRLRELWRRSHHIRNKWMDDGIGHVIFLDEGGADVGLSTDAQGHEHKGRGPGGGQ
jgi:hypothetical protein